MRLSARRAPRETQLAAIAGEGVYRLVAERRTDHEARGAAGAGQRLEGAGGQQVIVDSFVAQRESVSGVSLDEEAANLLRFQRSYQAAARIMTAADEMTQTLLAF